MELTVAGRGRRARIVAHDTLCGDVEELFASDPTITSLVVLGSDDRFLLDRVRFDTAYAGPFGSDRRTLLARRPIADLATSPCTIVPAATSVQEAIDIARARPRGDVTPTCSSSTPTAP